VYTARWFFPQIQQKTALKADGYTFDVSEFIRALIPAFKQGKVVIFKNDVQKLPHSQILHFSDSLQVRAMDWHAQNHPREHQELQTWITAKFQKERTIVQHGGLLTLVPGNRTDKTKTAHTGEATAQVPGNASKSVHAQGETTQVPGKDKLSVQPGRLKEEGIKRVKMQVPGNTVSAQMLHPPAPTAYSIPVPYLTSHHPYCLQGPPAHHHPKSVPPHHPTHYHTPYPEHIQPHPLQAPVSHLAVPPQEQPISPYYRLCPSLS